MSTGVDNEANGQSTIVNLSRPETRYEHFIDNKPEERKGRIITVIALVLIVYAVVMTVWSLL